jgi:iron complex outermembrane receptor protein
VVVSEERLDTYVRNHPRQVEILEEDEIQGRGFLSVDEALGSLPGVDVRRGGPGLGARIRIRGGGGSGPVRVLLDGRPFPSSQYGGVDLGSVPVESVKRILVFKPPVPVWIGPGGAAGAIQIVTRSEPASKRQEPERAGHLKVEGGSYGVAAVQSAWEETRPEGGLRLAAGASRREGKRPNSDRESGNVSVRWRRTLPSQTRLDVDGRFYDTRHGSSGPTDNPTPHARQHYRKGELDLHVDGLLGDSAEYEGQVYGILEKMEDRSEEGATYDLDLDRFGAKGEMVWPDEEGGGALRVGGLLETAGAAYTRAGSMRRETASLHVQTDRELGAWTLSLGLRGDYESDFGVFPSLRAGIGRTLGPDTTLKANAGATVNIPSFAKLIQPVHGSVDQVRGNPDLTEEKVRSYDLGVEHRFSPVWRAQVVLFRTETDDLIAYQRGDDRVYRPVNVSGAWKQGLEVGVKARWEKALSVEASYIRQETRNRVTGGELTYAPGHRGKFTVQAPLPWEATVEAMLQVVGSRYADLRNRPGDRLDGYATLGIKYRHPVVLRGLQGSFFVYGENLLDSDYEAHAGYPNDGFRFTAGFNWTF